MAPSMNYHQLRAQRKLLATGNPTAVRAVREELRAAQSAAPP